MNTHPTQADLASLYHAQLRRARKAARNAKGFVTGSVRPDLKAGDWVVSAGQDPATGLVAGARYQIRDITESINPANYGVRVALLEGFPLQGARIGKLIFDGYRLDNFRLTDTPEREG